jgi:hypothetical protein
MAIILNDNLKINVGKPIDSKYLNGLVPYVNQTEVFTKIPIGERYIGQTINIGNAEYWFKSGLTNSDLELKTAGTSISGVTSISNIGGGTGNVASTVSGDTAEFRTIIGSGDTTVTTVGDNVIIYSEGSAKEFNVTTATSVSISASTTNAIFIASGTTGYTLSSSPTIATELTFVDGLGTGLSSSINIDGNGKTINGFTNALLNTNYGSMTLTYNGINWNVISFIS